MYVLVCTILTWSTVMIHFSIYIANTNNFCIRMPEHSQFKLYIINDLEVMLISAVVRWRQSHPNIFDWRLVIRGGSCMQRGLWVSEGIVILYFDNTTMLCTMFVTQETPVFAWSSHELRTRHLAEIVASSAAQGTWFLTNCTRKCDYLTFKCMLLFKYPAMQSKCLRKCWANVSYPWLFGCHEHSASRCDNSDVRRVTMLRSLCC